MAESVPLSGRWSSPVDNARPTYGTQGSSPPRLQDDLKKAMKAEIGQHTWWFDDDRRVARMVCHKTRKPDAPIPCKDVLDSLENYVCDSDSWWFTNGLESAAAEMEKAYRSLPPAKRLRPGSKKEAEHYDGVGTFFNLAIRSASRMVPELPDDGPFAKFGFGVYDRPTGDGVNDAAELKPDLAGIRDHTLHTETPTSVRIREGVALFWFAAPDSCQPSIGVPVEVKDTWRDMVHQATTYARAMFFASPLRRFCPVIIYNSLLCRFHFLIYHRGGISSSRPFDAHSPDGRKGMLRMLMSLMTCKNRVDAGYASWNDNFLQIFRLPVDGSTANYVNATTEQILHADNCSRGRATHVYRISYAVGGSPVNTSLPSTPATPSSQSSNLPELRPRISLQGGVLRPYNTQIIDQDNSKLELCRK
ncbi:hypothetical protein FB45DRAFT_1023911 [Roridomyces roridus]|uniref:Fungal-type protein kinase domain-containing protein n=1 Tax=Roridomyces roridus TaxID=1738132 RepID=A0AAD7C5H2_9AGAR|nr:hypothetical protein FB45DRAFT_1023911 [Roridomyces roridus]